jgi:hypothetical protein
MLEITDRLPRPEYQFPMGWSPEVADALAKLRELAALERASERGAGQADVDELARCVERLREALATDFVNTGSAVIGGYNQSDTSLMDSWIFRTLATARHRMSGPEIYVAMVKDKSYPGWKQETVRKRLTALRKDGKLTNDPRAKLRGYGFPSWET